MSDEVSQFLESVERLRGQQIEEDEVRARELEEYLAAKRERQARRQDRARSISPQKSSPANTPSPRSSYQSSRVPITDGPKLGSPAPSPRKPRELSADLDSDPDAMSFSSSPTKENVSPAAADPDAELKRFSASNSPGRSPTLSWQQRRPGSRAGSRPLSMVAAQNATQRSFAASQEPPAPAPAPATAPEPAAAPAEVSSEAPLSRGQIAQSLGSKDPAWFRQTAERGQGSAAYRRNQVEDQDRPDLSTANPQLPGMSDPARDRSPSASSTATNQGKLASPFPLSAPRNPPVDEEPDSVDTPARSPTGRMSPTRSTSPTKGMGGFVQSAMMKRTDSVKRWSVQSPPGLARADSATSIRSSYTRSRPLSVARPDAKSPDSSRPTSQHGESDSANGSTPRASVVESPPETKPDEGKTIPSSPTKTMDSRRWSPTKSSWLDSALNKPESAKPQPKSHTPAQPSWMAELNKNKTGGDHGRAGSVSHKHQVSIGGLMRSSPMGAGVKPNTTDLGGIYSPPARGNRPGSMSVSPVRTGFPRSAVASPGGEDGPEGIRSPGPSEAPEPSITESSATSKEDGAAAQSESVSSEPAAAPEPTAAEPPVPEPMSAASPTPTQTKPKPETPPKKDFRSNLRQRAAESGPSKTEEPEFKNALGNLRRARTQNYVAPDELKDNILRGKAGLAVTGGPKKTERKDEFKEAILKKKGEFSKTQADGKGITRTPTGGGNATPIPEGLARRAQLGKTRKGSDVSSDTSSPALPKKPESPKPAVAVSDRPPSQASFSSRSPSVSSLSVKSPPPATQPERVSADLPKDVASPQARTPLGIQRETSPRPNIQGRPGGGKLADRFNPGLASMLARGPPPMATEGGQASGESASGRTPSESDSSVTPAPGPQLTHMTKGRARGPRRKAPSATAAASQKKSSSPSSTTPASEKPVIEPESRKLGEPLSFTSPPPRSRQEPVSRPGNDKSTEDGPAAESSKPDGVPDESPNTPAPLSIQQQVASRAALRGRPTPTDSPNRASAESKMIESAMPLPLKRQPTSPERELVNPPSPIRAQKTGGDVSQPGSPKKLDVKRMSKFLDDSSVTGTPKTEPVKEPIKLSHQRTGSRSPVKTGLGIQLPSTKPEDETPTPNRGGIASRFGAAKTPSQSPIPGPKPTIETSQRTAAPSTPKTQAASIARPLPMTPANQGTESPLVESPARSPSKQASELSALLTDFFGPGRPRRDYKVDPAALLASRPDDMGAAKIETISSSRFQIYGDGKKVPVQAHNERTLFEQEMYLCTHEFVGKSGKKTLYVYLWVGDDISASAVEDAQVFAQQEAKALRSKLIKLTQGKETADFLQALGGTVVTRRGSSHKHDSLAPTMLCGRRHLSQVVFDEVDFTPLSLCAGFAYLIGQGGKCYVWKGKGSNVDELSCARLVGMDMTLTGELIEYEEGSEPSSFWDMFGSSSKPYSADHWRLKPNYAKYGSRLFCSDADSRQQITEISPFSQADLSPSKIYVLDAFFEMYVVVGSQTQPQFASFRNALTFAQDYAILAASIEDRPFVPISTVVLEGVPRDLKRVFRKWSDEKSPTITRDKADDGSGPGFGSSTLRRGRSLRVVPLTQALQALRY